MSSVVCPSFGEESSQVSSDLRHASFPLSLLPPMAHSSRHAFLTMEVPGVLAGTDGHSRSRFSC
jgi:hypothetical protein